MAAAATSTIEQFPTELKQCLLSALPDIHSLRALTLSCSSFYHAFKNAESLITPQVVRNQFDSDVLPDVLPEAVIALKASRLPTLMRPNLLDFSQDFLRSRTAPTETWTLSTALPLSKLQLSVEYFATAFIAEMFNRSSALGCFDTAPPSWPVSRDERNRIHRAFYRFEIYCNLFRQSKLFRNAEQKQTFFSRFSYWENEQLACIHDYLFRAVCPGVSMRDQMCNLTLTMTAFNEATESEQFARLKLQAVNVHEYGDKYESPDIKHILSLGLERLQQIVTAKSCETQYSLLAGESFGLRILYFLADGLQSSNQLVGRQRLGDYTQAQYEALVRARPAFAPESDTGPADAWRWAHENHEATEFAYSRDHTALRAHGYCLWDRARLDAWPTFHQKYQVPVSLSDIEGVLCRVRMRLSLNRRTQAHD